MRRLGWSLFAVVLLCAFVARAQISTIWNDTHHTGGGGTLAVGNSCGANVSSGTTVSCTLSTAASSGILVACAVANTNGNASNVSASSTSLGSWGSDRAASTAVGADFEIEFTKSFSSALSSEAVTLTATGGASYSFATLEVFEVENGSTFDTGGPQTSTGPDPINFTNATAVDIVYGCLRGSTASPTAGSGWTGLSNTGSGSNFHLVEYQKTSSTGTLSVSQTTGSGTSNGIVADGIH